MHFRPISDEFLSKWTRKGVHPAYGGRGHRAPATHDIPPLLRVVACRNNLLYYQWRVRVEYALSCTHAKTVVIFRLVTR
jgi:hypothetical protein